MRRTLFPHATPEQWGDWRWQMQQAVRSLEELEQLLPLTEEERVGCQQAASQAGGGLRLGITPYYLSLVDRQHPFCPVRMQAIPVRAEGRLRPGELLDPLGEDRFRPVPAIVHKYPDRVLLLVSHSCPVYCRHCTRRRLTRGGALPDEGGELERGLAYIQANPRIRDVLISGGEPLLLSDARLLELLAALRAIDHLEIIRLGTRAPVCLPMRVTSELVRLLRRFAPLYVITHFNHPKELTPESRAACERLVDQGVPVENQAVLLRRVNSSARIIGELSHLLLKARVRPYYLHQMDLAQGVEHLRTPISAGLEILEGLRGHTSGLAVPHLAVDLPGGGGKVTLQPQYLIERRGEHTLFRSYLGESYLYPEPEETDCDCPYDPVWLQAREAGSA